MDKAKFGIDEKVILVGYPSYPWYVSLIFQLKPTMEWFYTLRSPDGNSYSQPIKESALESMKDYEMRREEALVKQYRELEERYNEGWFSDDTPN